MLSYRLKSGDTIGIIAPAGPVEKEKLEKSFSFFKNLGLKIKLGEHVYDQYGYLAGKDADRLADFHDMIADRKIKAIIFARGGYGTGRIVDKIDVELIKRNPKIIWGYSDITYLHTAIRQATGLVTFHGPMPASDMIKNDFDALSSHLFKQLFEPTQLTYSESISPLTVYREGEARGEIVGGNLSLLVQTLGTPYEICAKGKLLFIEDIGEEPYRVDGMLNQLRLAGKLQQCAGIIIGDFADAAPKVNPSLSLEEVWKHYFRNAKKPVIGGFRIGHCFPHFSIPLGVEAVLSSGTKTLRLAPGVR
ncbi:LD-carboxypeptidase [Oceanobacillus sp. J11TS1]|uniref:S66 peptidase family protein n=1 Tax=Oceanobacillus sp. J11TS1 TaxID=2807191 RepID=UPI001B0B5C78|nr:LD-carboxypeptidase [Oceanobacillus sp. J11TS1]GIO25242.1 putative murein peptide carboxypeptidase [Oceanobacillus sp. J11TS1]